MRNQERCVRDTITISHRLHKHEYLPMQAYNAAGANTHFAWITSTRASHRRPNGYYLTANNRTPCDRWHKTSSTETNEDGRRTTVVSGICGMLACGEQGQWKDRLDRVLGVCEAQMDGIIVSDRSNWLVSASDFNKATKYFIHLRLSII